MSVATPQSQLELAYPPQRLGTPPVVRVPAGYVVRTYKPGDEPGFYAVLAGAGFGPWNEERLRPWIARIPPESWFMAVHGESGAIVATAMGLHDHSDRYPFGGELGWLATDPGHTSRGLGTAVSAAVTTRLIQAGYRNIHLFTEDFRLQALKLYLKLGYLPFLCASDTADRWERVCDRIGWAFTPREWPST